jgi:uncharacterized protein (TIGR03437 family)
VGGPGRQHQRHRVRRIAVNGNITTIAGSGQEGFAGDGGPATQARLASPNGLALDAAGNLYIADTNNHRIRVVSVNGNIQTIAGSGANGFSGDGGPATSAALSMPYGVAVDAAGRLFIADTGNDRIRVVLPTPATFNVLSNSLSFQAAGNGTAPVQEVRLTGSAAGLAFQATAQMTTGANWLTVTPTSGSLPAVLQVSINAQQLAPGQYTGEIVVTAPLASPATRRIPVTLTVPASQGPQLTLGTQSVSFNLQQGAEPSSASFSLAAAGGPISYTATVQSVSGGNWLTVSPASGTLTQGSVSTISLIAAPGNLGEGTYSAIVTITGGSSPLTLPVTMSIAKPQGKILLSQSGLTFTAVEGGGAPLNQTFGILNEGRGEMAFATSVKTLAGGNWLSLRNASGRVVRPLRDVGFVQVVPDTRNLKQGDYYAEVRVTSPGLPPQIVTVVLKVLPPGTNPGPEVDPSGLIFIGAQGSEAPSEDVRISNLQNTRITYASTSQTFDGAKWLSHLPAAATILPDEPRRIVVQPNFKDLTPGVRRGAVYLLFEDGTNRVVNILSIVPDPAASPLSAGGRGAIGCKDLVLRAEFTNVQESANVSAGQPVPIAVKVADGCGNLLVESAAAVKVTFSNGNPDISLAHIGGGVWTGTWRPVGAGGGTVTVRASALHAVPPAFYAGSTSRSVRMGTSNAPVVTQGSLAHAASLERNVPVAPGTLVTIYGANLADARRLNTAPLPTEVDGTQVLLGGEPLPLLYTSENQINAQVPYDLPVNTDHQVVVRRGATLSVPEDFVVAAAQPGIFTTNVQGTGQGVVMGPDQVTVADSAKPAQRGQAIVIYCAGLGAVTPEVAVGNAAPASPLSQTVKPATVTIGNTQAQVLFSGLTPGFTGLYQVNAIVPANAPTGGAVPLTISIDGRVSNTVTIAIR